MNDIKYTIEAFDKNNMKATLYGATLLDSASVETVLALNDELFTPDTLFVVRGIVDNKEIYSSGVFERNQLDERLDTADETIERAIK